MTVYSTENIINCRDLGGYACKGGVTAPGRAIRCGIPKDPTENDIRILKEAGVKTVIDLRGVQEARNMPSLFADGSIFDYHHVTLLEANPALTSLDLPVWRMYMISLEEHGDGYAKALRIIMNLDEPFLFHCFLGKDRTGLLSAILLSCAGVSREDILRNYECSFDLFKPFVEREIAMKTGLIWEQDISRLMSDRENLGRALDCVDEKYGGISGYLGYIGFNDEEIDKIGKKLL